VLCCVLGSAGWGSAYWGAELDWFGQGREEGIAREWYI
jgi:hypothetical protein